MPPGRLGPLLDGVTTQEWYRLLNGKTFFWVTEERLTTFLCAKLYRDREHDVITVDTGDLLRRHWGRITVASTNTGSTYNRSRRGLNAFQRIENYSPDGQRRDLAELAIDYCVPDIASVALSVERRGASGSRTVVPL